MQTFRNPWTARPTGRRRTRVLLLAGLLTPVVPGLSVLLAVPAMAHDRLESTDPADGSTVEVAPGSVVLTMSSAPLALGTQVQVSGPDGIVSGGDPQIVDDTVTQALTGDRPAGTYEVQWRVTSSDGHPISGSFAFTATASTGTRTGDPSPAPSTEPASSTPTGVDPSNPASDDGNGALLTVAAAVVVVGAGAGGVIGYRRRQR